MTAKDTITLPREVVELALEALEWSWGGEPMGTKELAAITALRAHLAAEQEKKTPAWWMDGLAATLMREGVNKHRAKEIAKGYWEAYCEVPIDEEQQE